MRSTHALGGIVLDTRLDRGEASFREEAPTKRGSNSRWTIVLVASGALLPGCVWRAYETARSSAAVALRCPEPQVRQAYLASGSAYHYRFQGCGGDVVIRCAEDVSAGRTACFRER